MKSLITATLLGTFGIINASPKVVTPVLVQPMANHYSEALITGIKQFENIKLSKQKDSYVDHRRWDKYGKCNEIGYGFTDNLVDAGIRFHKLPKGYKLPKTMTKKEADRFLIKVAIPICHALVRHYTNVNGMTLKQRDALIMFTYNLGEGALARLHIKDVTSLNKVPSKMKKYCYAGGKKLKGLSRRRLYEIALFSSKHHDNL